MIVAWLHGYAYVPAGFIGTDAAKVVIVYETSAAAPAEAFATLD